MCQRCSVGSEGGLGAVQIQRAVSQGVPGVGTLPFGNWCFGDHTSLFCLTCSPPTHCKQLIHQPALTGTLSCFRSVN